MVAGMPTNGRIAVRRFGEREWAELGEFQSISDAARRVLELEGDRRGTLFFRVYVEALIEQKSDATILCRLESQTEKGFYVLLRAVQ
jgi:hypothetical protein